jgi:hypothetical protein
VRRVGVLAELHDAKADGAALGRAPMGGEEGRAASSPRGGDVDVAVKSAVVMFTATALIPCLAPSGSRRHGTPGARSPVFETVVVLDGSGAGSCSVSSFVPVLGAALVVSGDGTLGMARLTVGGIGVGVRAEPRKYATGCGAPEHAATEQRGGAGDWESAERCGESEGKEKGKNPNWFGDKERMGCWSPPGRSVKGRRGQELAGAPIGRQGDYGDVAVRQWRAEAYGRHGAGVKGVFPWAEHTRRRPRRARCSACALVRPGSVARRAVARGEARLAVRWHPLRSEGEEEEQGRPVCGSRLAVREDRGKVRWARLGRG